MECNIDTTGLSIYLDKVDGKYSIELKRGYNGLAFTLSSRKQLKRALKYLWSLHSCLIEERKVTGAILKLFINLNNIY